MAAKRPLAPEAALHAGSQKRLGLRYAFTASGYKRALGVFSVATDTVMGWGAWLDDRAAIEELMRRKSRGLGDSKVFSLVLSRDDLLSGCYVVLNDSARHIVKDHGSSPLTLVLPKAPLFKHWYYDHYPEIGVRFASTVELGELASRGPFLLTSANQRGGVPEQIAGPPTTVARVVGEQIEVLRQGEIKL